MTTRETLAFRNRSFDIRSLTISQLEGIEGIINAGKTGIALACGIIEVGLSRDFAEVNFKADIEASPEQLAEAMRQILSVGGFPMAASAAVNETA